MIANYPIRIGVLEQGSQSPMPLTIPDGTGLFLDIRLGNGLPWVDNGRMFTLPLNPNNAYGVIDWGDGSPIRDFIHSEDVARGMMMMVEKGINEPVNLGS